MPRYDLIRVETRGGAEADRVLARDFDRAQRRLQDELNRTMRRIGEEVEPIYRAYAPVDQGNLAGSIESVFSFRAARIRLTVTAEGFAGGFNYLRITREGHVTPFVRPRRRFAMKVYINGRGTVPILRRSVRGYRPKTDWVEDATKLADRVIDTEERRLSRNIDTVLLSSARAR